MSVLEHHFHPLVAEKYGVNAAIFLRDVYHWCETNRNNGENFHEGRWWTYQTISGLCKRHTYWTRNQIEHIIRSCKEKGALLSGHFGENQFDRTCWYALTDEALVIFEGPSSISENSGIDSKEISDSRRKNPKCYKDKHKSEDKAYNPLPPKNSPDEVCAVLDEYAGEDGELRRRLDEFLETRRKNKKPLHTSRAATLLAGRLEKLSGGDRACKLTLLDNAILHGWESVYPLKPDERPGAPPSGGWAPDPEVY